MLGRQQLHAPMGSAADRRGRGNVSRRTPADSPGTEPTCSLTSGSALIKRTRTPRGMRPLVHHGRVRTHESRDDNIVAIAIALGLFVLSLAVGSVLAWAISRSDPTTSPIFGVVPAISATVALVFLVRARKP